MNSLGLDLNCECRFCDPAKRDFVGPSMNQGKLVFAQLMQHLPLTAFRRLGVRYLVYNLIFVVMFALQLTGLRSYHARTEGTQFD